MSRWQIDVETDSDGRQRFKVRDRDDRHGPPVAEFASEREARDHVEHLGSGPFDWDEQRAWQDPDDEDDDDQSRSSWL